MFDVPSWTAPKILVTGEAMATSHLPSNISGDPLGFGQGDAFNPKAVALWLALTRKDISHLANVPVSSVRWDERMPKSIRTRMEQVAETCNLVARAFDNSRGKAALWFRTRNPLLGDIAPRDMVRLGRMDRLHKFVVSALDAQSPMP
jgi:hypothetical protein